MKKDERLKEAKSPDVSPEIQAVLANDDDSDIFDLATERVNQIEGLMQKISTTEDQKAIAELQARIAIEQASLQNEHTKLQMFGLIQQAEQRILEQQAHEDYIKWATTTEMPVLIDIDWRE